MINKEISKINTTEQEKLTLEDNGNDISEIFDKPGNIWGKIELEFDGKKYHLDYRKSYFEYPKNIQEETGILGYERIKINDQTLFNIFKDLYEKKYNLDFWKNSITSFKEFNEFLFKRKKEAKEKKDFYKWKDYLANFWLDYSAVYNCRDSVLSLVSIDILKKLSNGEYPSKCDTHIMGGYAWKDKDKMFANFKKQKYFLQKIYDLKTIKELYKWGIEPSKILDYNVNSCDDKPWCGWWYSPWFAIYDTKTSEVIKEKERVGNLINYEDDFKSGKVYAANFKRWINFQEWCFWDTGGYIYDTIAFGFPRKRDSFQEEYFNKVLDRMVILYQNKSLYRDSLHSLFQKYCINEYIKQYGNIFSDKDLTTKKMWKFIDKYFIKKWIKNFLTKENIESISNIWYPKWETYLPIVVWDKKIPQLSWGHAKYAHFFDEKGFNFFEFKHTNDLPSKK